MTKTISAFDDYANAPKMIRVINSDNRFLHGVFDIFFLIFFDFIASNSVHIYVIYIFMGTAITFLAAPFAYYLFTALLEVFHLEFLDD
jgi:hypothetical protein